MLFGIIPLTCKGHDSAHSTRLVADVCHVNVQVTRQFAMLHAKDGIRINSVNPGYVLTDVYGRTTSDSPVFLRRQQVLLLNCAVLTASLDALLSAV